MFRKEKTYKYKYNSFRMGILLATLGKGKGSWNKLVKLINKYEWKEIILYTNSFGKERFNINKNITFVVDKNRSLKEEIKELVEILKDIKDLDVAVCIVSGESREHMILLGAVMSSGLGFRIIDENGEEITVSEIDRHDTQHSS